MKIIEIKSFEHLISTLYSSDYCCGHVFFRGVRHDSQGEGLDFGYNILIYFDDAENYIFKYFEHLGW